LCFFGPSVKSRVIHGISPCTPPSFTSGDVIADRRADYARMLAESGDPAAAVELMEQALELAPDWAAGWLCLGD